MRCYVVTAEKDGFDIGEFFTPTSAIDLSSSWCRVAEVTDLVDHIRRLTYIDSQDDLDIIEELCDLAGVEWDAENDDDPWELAEKAAGRVRLSVYE